MLLLTAPLPADLAARFGGEEFAAVLPNTTFEGAQKVAEDMRRRIEELHISHETATISDHLTVSIGVAAIVPPRHSTPVILLEAADVALYEAKRMGRNRVVAR